MRQVNSTGKITEGVSSEKIGSFFAYVLFFVLCGVFVLIIAGVIIAIIVSDFLGTVPL